MSFDLINLIRPQKKNLGCIFMCRKKQLFSFYSLYCLKKRQVLFYLIRNFGLKNVYLLSYNLDILCPVSRPFCVIKLHEDSLIEHQKNKFWWAEREWLRRLRAYSKAEAKNIKELSKSIKEWTTNIKKKICFRFCSV